MRMAGLFPMIMRRRDAVIMVLAEYRDTGALQRAIRKEICNRPEA